MEFSISDERLEQIEFEVVEDNYEKIKYAEEKKKLLLASWLFLCLDSDQLYASYNFAANNWR